jgi:hypothetical protein
MVDIHSITASSQPSHREQEAEGEATSRPRVGQSHHADSHNATPTTAAIKAAPQHQRLATIVVTPPPTAGPEATLVVVHALLNNPPSPDASPEAAE